MIKLSRKQQQIFDGLIISDAHLTRTVKSSYNSSFSLTSKSNEFAHNIVHNLEKLGWSNSPVKEYIKNDKRTGTSYKYHVIKSKVSSFLTKQRDRWYPNNIKIVPNDIVVDKNMLLWWYIGDGYLKKKKSRPNYRRVELATDSFSQEDNLRLIELLKDFLQEDDNIYLERNEIMISKKVLSSFANIFKNSCPVSFYEYKFDFGQYLNKDYFKDSFKDRPLKYINDFRRENKVRELNYVSKNEIQKVGV